MGNNKIISKMDIRFKPNIIFFVLWIAIFAVLGVSTTSVEKRGEDGEGYYNYYVSSVLINEYCMKDELVSEVIKGLIPFIILGLVIPLFILLKNFIIAKGCNLVLEENQIVGTRRRLFSSQQIQMPIEKLDNVFISRGIIDILFCGGSLVSIHSNSGIVRFPMLHNADEFSSACIAQIEKFKGKVNNNPDPAPVQPAANDSSLSEKLKELQELKAQGIITDEQFEAKKQELLSKF